MFSVNEDQCSPSIHLKAEIQSVMASIYSNGYAQAGSEAVKRKKEKHPTLFLTILTANRFFSLFLFPPSFWCKYVMNTEKEEQQSVEQNRDLNKDKESFFNI